MPSVNAQEAAKQKKAQEIGVATPANPNAGDIAQAAFLDYGKEVFAKGNGSILGLSKMNQGAGLTNQMSNFYAFNAGRPDNPLGKQLSFDYTAYGNTDVPNKQYALLQNKDFIDYLSKYEYKTTNEDGTTNVAKLNRTDYLDLVQRTAVQHATGTYGIASEMMDPEMPALNAYQRLIDTGNEFADLYFPDDSYSYISGGTKNVEDFGQSAANKKMEDQYKKVAEMNAKRNSTGSAAYQAMTKTFDEAVKKKMGRATLLGASQNG